MGIDKEEERMREIQRVGERESDGEIGSDEFKDG